MLRGERYLVVDDSVTERCAVDQPGDQPGEQPYTDRTPNQSWAAFSSEAP
jgi:hypothetical protein